MAWTKRKTGIVAGIGALLAGGILTGLLCRHTIGHAITVAGGKLAISRHEAAPVDLANTIEHYGWPAERFDQISFSMWKSVPRGFQVLDHVPFQINGAFALWGESNAKKTHINFPEQIPNIVVNQKFATLYLLHMAFFSERNNTPVYEVVFHYEDGFTATNQLLYGNDILEWGLNKKRGRVVGPTSPNSKLAWAGGSELELKKNPVRVCLTAVKNPMPLTKVTSIDLNSCKSQSAGCILAMTTGRAGLMQ